MSKKVDLIGEEFGRWVVLSAAKSKKGRTMWTCVCSCGIERDVGASDLGSGKSKSCGCLRSELTTARTHGLSKTRLYRVWKVMRERCNSKSNKDYARYGGRGITVCVEWEDPTVFISWAKANGYKQGLEIDRYPDGDGNYAPENCRFTSHHRNSLNRLIRSTNKTGYCGSSVLASGKFKATLGYLGKTYCIGTFPSAKSAAVARDKFIIKNNWPHKLNFPRLRNT